MSKTLTFKTYLDSKTQNYDKIDKDLIFKLWRDIKEEFTLPSIIHIVGTNGKGSSGRFLALLLSKSSLNVGHYTSPHIEKFNERIWIDGHNATDQQIEIAHKELQNINHTDINSLSYFEYTTLLGMKVMSKCDFAVVEAGQPRQYPGC